MPLRYLDDPDDLDRFLDLREERDRIDAELDSLAPVILAALEDEDDGQTSARGYVLRAKVRRTYAYPSEVADVSRYLAEIKAAARSDGTATVDKATGYVEVKASRPIEADRLRALAAEAVTAALAQAA